MMKILGLGGAPCSGKSTIARYLLQGLELQGFKYKRLRGHVDQGQKFVVLGLYPGEEMFGGTDKLSMSVMPDALQWLELMHGKREPYRIFFEGDRLFVEKFLRACQRRGVCLFPVLQVAAQERANRKEERGDTQNEKFVKGRTTKYERLLQLPDLCVARQNDNLRHQAALLADFRGFLGLGG